MRTSGENRSAMPPGSVTGAPCSPGRSRPNRGRVCWPAGGRACCRAPSPRQPTASSGPGTRSGRYVNTSRPRYWAARWQPIPGQRRPLGARSIEAALDALPGVDITGGARTRIAQLEQTPSWPVAVAALKSPVETMEVPAALDALVDAAVTRYGRWAHGDPIMLVHAATAPRAAALVLPALSKELWRDTYDTAWAVAAAISSAYLPADHLRLRTDAASTAASADEIAERAVASGDEHAIKFAEVARESHRRGNIAAMPAAARATALIGSQ